MEDISISPNGKKGYLNGNEMTTALLIAAVVVLIPAVAAVAVIGPDLVDEKALIVFPLILLIGFAVVGLLMTRDPLMVIGNVALVMLPIIGHSVPPKRFTVSVFDVLGTVAIIAFLASLRSPAYRRAAKPEWWVTLPVLIIIPTVLLGLDWRESTREWFEILATYCLFAALLRACDDVKDWNERIAFWAAVALTLVAAGIVFERFTRINLSLADANLNADAEAGIYRAGGFFQDPQKAAQFMGCFFTFFVVLLVRRVATATKVQLMMVVASLCALVAMFMTVSRLSLVSSLALSATSVILVNRFKVLFKTFLLSGTVVAIWVLAAAPSEVLSLLPDSLAHRLSEISHSSKVRMDIWIESLRYFSNDPIAGVGPGNYQEALMRDHLSLRMRHQLGKYVPDQPESGYLKILVETGLIGVLAALIFLCGLIRSIWRCCAREPHRSYALAATFAFLVFAASFTTLFTVKDERNLMMMLVLVAVLHRNQVGRASPASEGAA